MLHFIIIISSFYHILYAPSHLSSADVVKRAATQLTFWRSFVNQTCIFAPLASQCSFLFPVGVSGELFSLFHPPGHIFREAFFKIGVISGERAAFFVKLIA